MLLYHIELVAELVFIKTDLPLVEYKYDWVQWLKSLTASGLPAVDFQAFSSGNWEHWLSTEH